MITSSANVKFEKLAKTAEVIIVLFLIIIFILPDAIQIDMTDRHVRLQW